MGGACMWETVTFTDGDNLHGIVFRWNHWIGDGIATQLCMSRLFGFPYELSSAIQSRRTDLELVTWRMKLRFVAFIFRELRKPKHTTWLRMHLRGKTNAERVQYAVDNSRAVILPSHNFDLIKAAAKSKGTSVFAVLCAACQRTVNELLCRYAPEGPLEKVVVRGTVALSRDIALCNSLAVFTAEIPSEASTKEIGERLAAGTQETVELAPAVNWFFSKVDMASFCERIWNDLAKTPGHDAATFMLTSLPGPSEQVRICDVPVTSWFNTLGDSKDPLFTCFSYNGTLYTVFNTFPKVQTEAEAIKTVWSEQLAAVCAGSKI